MTTSMTTMQFFHLNTLKIKSHLKCYYDLQNRTPVVISYESLFKQISYEMATHVRSLTSEPRCEKTGLQGFRPGPTHTRLYTATEDG